MTDLALAIIHHVLVFGLVAIMAIEFVLFRPGLNGETLQRLGRLDAGYGVCASLIIVVGIGRVIFGVKGTDYYLSNPWFWAKMITFGLIGVLSIAPTLFLLQWRKAHSADPAFTPAVTAVKRARRYIAAELALLPIVLMCAAAMARRATF
jgi:putative membrane protein